MIITFIHFLFYLFLVASSCVNIYLFSSRRFMYTITIILLYYIRVVINTNTFNMLLPWLQLQGSPMELLQLPLP